MFRQVRDVCLLLVKKKFNRNVLHLPWKIVSCKQLFDIFPTATAGKASVGVRAGGRSKGGNCLPQKFSVEYRDLYLWNRLSTKHCLARETIALMERWIISCSRYGMLSQYN